MTDYVVYWQYHHSEADKAGRFLRTSITYVSAADIVGGMVLAAANQQLAEQLGDDAPIGCIIKRVEDTR
jgi:hypothetical protein